MDCLQRSRDKLISSAYFYELSENLQALLNDVSQRDKMFSWRALDGNPMIIAELFNLALIIYYMRYIYETIFPLMKNFN